MKEFFKNTAINFLVILFISIANSVVAGLLASLILKSGVIDKPRDGFFDIAFVLGFLMIGFGVSQVVFSCYLVFRKRKNFLSILLQFVLSIVFVVVSMISLEVFRINTLHTAVVLVFLVLVPSFLNSISVWVLTSKFGVDK